MTQHSNREPYAPWGEPVRDNPTGWWTSLLTVPALVRHLVLMFTTMAVITAVNLLTTPGTWWSLALLVFWVAVLIIHGLGLLAIGVLLDDDDGAARPAARPQPEVQPAPQGPALPGWLRARGREASEAPMSWELRDDDAPGASRSWPDPPAEGPGERAETSAEQGSWRAVTDIAWLRQPRANGATRDSARPEDPARRDREASS